MTVPPQAAEKTFGQASDLRAEHQGTPRELEVLRRLAEGLTQGEIGLELVISPRTVGTHIQNVLGKLDVHSRAQAVTIAHRERLVPLGGGHRSRERHCLERSFTRTLSTSGYQDAEL